VSPSRPPARLLSSLPTRRSSDLEGLLARVLELSVLELVRVFGSEHSRRELSSIPTWAPFACGQPLSVHRPGSLTCPTASVIAGSSHGSSAAHPKHFVVLGAVFALPTATDRRRTLPGLRLRPHRLGPDSEPGRNRDRRRHDGSRARRQAALSGSQPRGFPTRARPR